MRAASRDAVEQARGELSEIVSGGSGGGLADLGSEIYAVAGALADHIDLRRFLVDASNSEQSRVSLVEAVFGEKVGENAVRVLSTLVRGRVSTSTDLVEAVEELGRDACLAASEADDTLSEVEDELFRFGRILDREPQLRSLLADTSKAADQRVGLLDAVLDDRVDTVTHRLLEYAVRRPPTRPLDRTAEVLAEAAAARRDRSIARVTAPVVLGEEQERRLGDALSSIYDRRISVHVDVDPDILGGLIVRVSGEVIDGSILGRLRRASTAVPG